MSNRFFQHLGLCHRAGRLVSGEFACENCIKSGNAKLIILAEDASKNTIRKFNNSSKFYNIDLISKGLKSDLGKCIGKDYRAIIVVTDSGFKDKLISYL